MKIVLDMREKHNLANPDNPIIKVSEIVCQAGLLACFENKALEDCFEIFAEGSVCEGAKLVINAAPLDCVCDNCGRKFTLKKKNFICPDCESSSVSFKGGNGLELIEMNCETRF